MRSKNASSYFVTGTDTDIGKTTITHYLITQLQKRNFTAMGCKPVACGVDQFLNNKDVQTLQAVNSLKLTQDKINPLCFSLPASPDIAARVDKKSINYESLIKKLIALCELPVDYLFFEGIGGWNVPLTDQETMADVAKDLNIPILLVVGIRVGCLNHALLTFDAIRNKNLKLVGWIGNVIDPNTPHITEHIATLQRWICGPYLGTLPYGKSLHSRGSYLDLNLLINHVA